MPEPVVKFEVRNVRKEYPGTVALEDASLSFRAGQVHALLGKNGAGKSTLVKIMAGVIAPTSGSLLLDGGEVNFTSPHDAQGRGVATVHQELSLIPGLSVAENMLFSHLPRKQWPAIGRWVVDWRETESRARELFRELEVNIDVRVPVKTLGTAEQQVVEIAKAMSTSPSVLLLDEPTSALSAREARMLFRLVHVLKARGVAIVYISHRLHELREVCDVVSVLRDGRCAGTITMAEATPARISEMMFGRAVAATKPPASLREAKTVLRVESLTRENKFQDVSFSVGAGEVLGIAGVVGAGRTELLTAIFGSAPPDSGTVEVDGVRVSHPTPRKMKALGVGLTPEDRRHHALAQSLSVRENLGLASLASLARMGVMSPRLEREMIQHRVEELHIALANADQPVSLLSGGNQQKVVIANWLSTKPRVMLLDEPTRGIDIQAKRQIFQVIEDLTSRGIAIVFVSSELEELVEVCHRILVLRSGRIVGEVKSEQFDLGALLALCMEE